MKRELLYCNTEPLIPKRFESRERISKVADKSKSKSITDSWLSIAMAVLLKTRIRAVLVLWNSLYADWKTSPRQLALRYLINCVDTHLSMIFEVKRRLEKIISKLYTIISNQLWDSSLYFGDLYNRWVLASQQKALGPCKCARFRAMQTYTNYSFSYLLTFVSV